MPRTSEDNTRANITRRGAIGAGLGMLAASAALLSSCSQAPQEDSSDPSSFDYQTHYLPLGSVVHIKEFPGGIDVMIVSRRPYSTNATTGEVILADYAGVLVPLGMLSDMGTNALDEGELTQFTIEDIEYVSFVGYQGGDEPIASALLDAGKTADGSDDGYATGPYLLYDLEQDYYTRFKQREEELRNGS